MAGKFERSKEFLIGYSQQAQAHACAIGD